MTGFTSDRYGHPVLEFTALVHDAQARFGQTRQAAGATRHQCRTVAVLPLQFVDVDGLRFTLDRQRVETTGFFLQ